jgi:serine/threonine-protein kinase
MPFRGTVFDREFVRQALGEKRLTEAQTNELLGGQMGLADQGIERALPVLAHEMGFLSRPLVEQLIRHVLRRRGRMRIGGYDLLGQVGRGGMGVVYLAEQLSLKRNVALKLLIRQEMSQKFVDRFRREGRACAQIRHPCLVAAFDVGTADGWHYFSMEYVDGPTLTRAVRENGPFSELEGIHITRRIAEALAAAHENGVIHRDVKPGNIMVASNGTPKLCDLGLARIRNVDESELYEPGTTLGSRRYMSPEHARGLESIDARSDIYSLGLTLFFMVTGVPPFSDVPKEEVMLEHIRGLLEWPADVNPNLSEEVSAMVWRMAAKEPERRPQSAHEAAGELRQLEEKLRASAEFGPGEHEPGSQWTAQQRPAPGPADESKPIPPPIPSDDEQTSEFKPPVEF